MLQSGGLCMLLAQGWTPELTITELVVSPCQSQWPLLSSEHASSKPLYICRLFFAVLVDYVHIYKMDIKSSCFQIKSRCIFRAIFKKKKSKLHEIHTKGKLKWSSPWTHVKSACLCSETKLEHLCILKYTWKKWMYFFLQRMACFTQWWRGGNICVTLCASVLKSPDIIYIWGKWLIASKAPLSFSGK